jgi:hypothetical protein
MKADDVKSETDVSSFSSTRNNNSRTQIQKLTLIVSITALVIFGFFIAVPSTIIVAQLPPPPSSPSRFIGDRSIQEKVDEAFKRSNFVSLVIWIRA